MVLLLQIHSIVRWFVVLTGLIAFFKFLIGWLQKGSYQKFDRIITAAFSGLMDLQGTLGLILLLWNGLVDGAGFPRYRLEHMGMMILAIALTHMQARFKTAPDTVRFRNSALIILGVFVLIYFAVAVLPGGWTR